MFKFAVVLFSLLIALSVVVIIYDSPQSPKPTIRKDQEVVSNPVIKEDQRVSVSTREKANEYLPNFLKVKGLETVKLFKNMYADDSYYRKAVRNPNDYHKLVGDKRIYNKDEVTLIYQYHCYRFFKYYGSMDDMKGDFLGAFLREYHGFTQSEIDKFALVADGYANP